MTPDLPIVPSSPSAWDPYLAGNAQRETRLPRVVRCVHCNGMRFDLGGTHAPRWRDGVLVDCAGQEVRS